MTQVRKRDGSLQKFDKDKIINAIMRAGELPAKTLDKIIKHIVENVSDKEEVTISEIQRLVENELVKTKNCDIARDYISYRYLHDLARDKYKEMLKVIADKVFAKNVKNQNANVDEKSFGGRKGEMSSAILKEYALNYCMSEQSKMNHINNEIYIHDLDSYALGMHNCISLPIDDLLKSGFNTRQTDVRPAQSVNTAFQLLAVLFQLQSLNQFGGVAATHLDWTMIPYVRKSFYKHYKDGMKYIDNIGIGSNFSIVDTNIDSDIYKQNKNVWQYAYDMTVKETYQAVEGMYHNLNTLQSRSGNQLPFTSINYGTCTLSEGRLITRALLDVSIKGIGKHHKTSIFPCGIFQVMDGVNKHRGEPNYDLFRLALESTAKRLYPNYVNVDWSVNKGYDKNDTRTYTATMGCRTYNGYDINGFAQMKDGRGNICPVTIIMPTLAMEANCDVEAFMKLLDKKITEGIEMLVERYHWICSQDADSAKFMYENGTMYGYDGKNIESALKHGTLALGQIGLAETLQLLIGCDHTTERGMELAKRIEKLFNTRCKEYKNKYKLNVGVYYSPAENMCYTSMQKFKSKYGIIKNVSDKDYFTNSIHVPVYDKLDAFEKIDIESQLTGYSNAGCITYVELDATVKHNIDAIEKIVVYAMDKDVPYFAINVPNDTCNNCGYTDEINDKCPVCGSTDIKRLRRVTGYLTSDYHEAFNLGKQQEVDMRVKHTGVSVG